jgi:hypothetical protein
MDLYYLIYTSVPARPMKDAELQELLSIAREANSRFNVTGMLICLSESFIQLIEGPKQHIEQLYQNIQQDTRHLRVTTLREGPNDRRFFPDWTMAFKKRDDDAASNDILSLDDQRILQLFDILDY